MDAARDDDRWLLLAAITGMLAIVALPLSTVFAASDDTIGRFGVSVLAFATPATLFVAGRLHARAWMMSLGATLALVLLPIVILEVLVGLLLVSLLAGPILAAIVVGGPLRESDVVAAAGFYGGGTIAVIGGFAAAAIGPAGVAVLVVVAAGAGLAVTIRRLTRVAPTSSP